MLTISEVETMPKTTWLKCPFCGWTWEKAQAPVKQRGVKVSPNDVPRHKDGKKVCEGVGLGAVLFSCQQRLLKDLQQKLYRDGF